MAGFFGRQEEEKLQSTLITEPDTMRTIGTEEIQKAAALLDKYKQGKVNLEKRIVEDEQWYKLRHWDAIRKKSNGDDPEPASAWLFNAIMNKHADAMDNYPEPSVLPRERSDEEDAKALSSIMPVILERNDFESTYSDAWWEKLKHGTGVYGEFWDKELENGLGDITIRNVDLLNLFWEPGISDIQKSRNIFMVDAVDKDILEGQYPQLAGKLSGSSIEVKKYIYDDTVDESEKAVVVDWYYKAASADGQKVLHYVKFVGDTLLYASANDPQYADRGYYDHGKYPFFFDTMFPEKGTPVGFGMIAVCKDPQLYIDKLGGNILKNSMMATKKRFFVSDGCPVNEEEFSDWNRDIVHVAGGNVDDTKIKEINVTPLSGVYVNVLQMKIDELKETSANRDVSSGGASGGVTAAAGIAALQEAGNKGSRDTIGASFRRYASMVYLGIELLQQFYDEARCFRITGEKPDEYQFMNYSNKNIKEQLVRVDSSGMPLYRRPVFDIKIKAQKKNPFSRASQNELAKELYGMGMFAPERAEEALGALEMMEFEGKDKVMERVVTGQTLLSTVQQMAGQMEQMSAVLGQLTGTPDLPQGAAAPSAPSHARSATGGQSQEEAAAKINMTGYGERLAKRSVPNMDMEAGG